MLGARTRLWNQAVRASDLYLPGNGSFAPLLFLGEDVSGIRTEKEHLHICFAYFDHVSFLELVRFWVRFFPCYCSIFESDIFNLHITCCIWELQKICNCARYLRQVESKICRLHGSNLRSIFCRCLIWNISFA